MNRKLKVEMDGEVPVVSAEEVHRLLGKVRLIDVRRAEEFEGELGAIPGSELYTLGPDLTSFLEGGDRGEEIVLVCRSGARSTQATLEALRLGYRFPANLTGGMLRWNELKLLVERKGS